MNKPKNLLAAETSPYLLQHADNPVHWHPWNQQALDLAKQQNKPILLSIGYSACHWCHVMAHESFEDEDTAAMMNQYFINIKIDREERPDLDKIYQSAHSLLTSRPGGWPLTMFLSPDNQMPFFAGTYFPDQPRHNMPSFKQLMHHISDIFQHKQNDIKQQDASLQQMLAQISSHTKDETTAITAMPLDIARRQIETSYDEEFGGFSNIPKFPHPAIIERLLQHWAFMQSQQQDDNHALQMAQFSLQKMAQGGLFDHIGGGFCRYSTDTYWMIPHFEKMLYDNGSLLKIYSHAYQITKNKLFKRAVQLTAEWAIREMQSPEGGYYCAQDADSEGMEGKFYIWQQDEVKKLLADDYDFFAHCFGFDKSENFEGQWYPHMHHSLDQLSQKFNISEDALLNKISRTQKILFSAREQRIKPGLDDKILCSWNSLMINGMVNAGQILKQDNFIQSAKKSLDFIYQNLWQQRLLATYKDGNAHLNAYLDDYAYLLQALLSYLQYEWNQDYYQWAQQIADTLLEFFEDKEGGGFYFTSHDHENLIQRSKTFTDEAMPAGNGIAAQALQLLGLLSGNTRYLQAAEDTIKAGQSHIQNQAISHCSLLQAQQEFLHPPSIIILRGDKQSIKIWQDMAQKNYSSSLYCFALPSEITLDPNLAAKKPIGDICAYICTGMSCAVPITDVDEYQQVIQKWTVDNACH